jgi:tRNA (cytidine/uridine-2'-O-)-methyltransferase
MDYWPRLRLTVHDDTAALLALSTPSTRWLFSSKGGRALWDTEFTDGDCLVFGSETRGIDESLLAQHAPARILRIPQVEGERCLNLSTSVGIALYEALRQVTSGTSDPHRR